MVGQFSWGVLSAYTESKLACENPQPDMLFLIGREGYHGCMNTGMVLAGSADSHEFSKSYPI